MKKAQAKTVILKKLPAKDEPIAPQAAALLVTLKAKGGTLAVADLLAAAKGRVKTKQSMGRIWQYYKEQLLKSGCIALLLPCGFDAGSAAEAASTRTLPPSSPRVNQVRIPARFRRI
ncbi:MAG: hypothetical protein WA718_12895 [Terriglobales bacterium]